MHTPSAGVREKGRFVYLCPNNNLGVQALLDITFINEILYNIMDCRTLRHLLNITSSYKLQGVSHL